MIVEAVDCFALFTCWLELRSFQSVPFSQEDVTGRRVQPTVSCSVDNMLEIDPACSTAFQSWRLVSKGNRSKVTEIITTTTYRLQPRSTRYW